MPKKKKSSRNWLSILNSALLVGVILLLAGQAVQFYRFQHRLAFIDDLEGLSMAAMEDVQTSKQYLASFGTDLNEIREFLLLPTREYDFGEEQGGFEQEANDSLTLGLFNLVEQLSEFEGRQNAYGASVAELDVIAGGPMWVDLGLEANLVAEDWLVVEDVDFPGESFVEWKAEADGVMAGTFYDGEVMYDYPEENAIAKKAGVFHEGMTQLMAFRQYWEDELFESEEFEALLTEYGVSLDGPVEQEVQTVYRFLTEEGAEAAELILSIGELKAFVYMNVPVEEGNPFLELSVPEDTLADLEFALGEVDLRSPEEQAVDEFRSEMSSLLDDSGFKSVLKPWGYSFEGPDENETQINYYLKDSDGEVLRVIYMIKATGEVFVEQPGAGAQSLSAANAALAEALESKKKR